MASLVDQLNKEWKDSRTIKISVRDLKSTGESGMDMITDLMKQNLVQGVFPCLVLLETAKSTK